MPILHCGAWSGCRLRFCTWARCCFAIGCRFSVRCFCYRLGINTHQSLVRPIPIGHFNLPRQMIAVQMQSAFAFGNVNQ